MFTADDLARISEARGRSIVEAATRELGTMAAVNADGETVAAVLAGLDDVCIANYNAPLQTVISGSAEGITSAIEHFSARRIQAQQIPVSCAFHSPLVADARARLAIALRDLPLAQPHTPAFSNSTASEYPADPDAIRELLSDHLVNPVRFAQEVNAMYDAGARIFIEAGPKAVLTGLIGRCLHERPHLALALDRPERPGLLQLQTVLGTLAAIGVRVNLDPLFAGRAACRLDLDRLVEETREVPLPSSTWMISGGSVRPIAQERVMPEPVKLTPIVPADRGVVQAPVAHHQPAVSMPAAAVAPVTTAGADALPVLQEFQRTMAQLIESQERVMLAYLGGAVTDSQPRHVEWQPAIAAPAVAPVARDVAPELPRPAVATEPLGEAVPAAALALATPVARSKQLTEDDILSALLAIVVERTGYPRELVDIHASLEADLGIDSIKRVEVVGELWRSLPHGLTEPVQGLMEDLTSAPTLSKIAARLAAALVVTQSGSTQPAPAPEAVAGASPVSRVSADDIRKRLLEIVVERTGYPPDLVDQDANLEADLGIDSIKRVEITGELWRSFPHEGLETRAPELMEQLASARSLSEIVRRFAEVLDGGAAAPTPVAAAPAPSAAPLRPETPRTRGPLQLVDVPRFVMKPIVAELPMATAAPRGTIIVTDDGRGIATALVAALADRGIGGRILETGALEPGVDLGAVKARMADVTDLAGVVYLPPAGDDTAPLDSSPAAWRQRLRRETGALFTLVQVFGPALRMSPGAEARPRFLCATMLGGDFALGERAGAEVLPASHGGICGVTKTLAVERPDLAVKLVDSRWARLPGGPCRLRRAGTPHRRPGSRGRVAQRTALGTAPGTGATQGGQPGASESGCSRAPDRRRARHHG